MSVPFDMVLILATVVFLLGAICAMARRTLIMILLGVEIMLNAAGIAFVGASLRWMALDGQIFVLVVMGVAAAEIAIGLALAVLAGQRCRAAEADDLSGLKG